jgi:tRNA-Thr(GGU) m(6)t(6)A37 methyltransferase TsaA
MITIEPIGVVRNSRGDAVDDFWGGVVSEIVLNDGLGADALDGIEAFSHAEIIFYFHLVEDAKIVSGARHPRNNPEWPAVGILAQRGKNRPNRLGLTTVRIVERKGGSLFVADLDAIDGTPVLDIKPVMREFLPREPVRQPAWAAELMADYWKASPPA